MKLLKKNKLQIIKVLKELPSKEDEGIQSKIEIILHELDSINDF